MGDRYEAGQVGAMGPNAYAHDINFNQIWLQSKSSIDLEQLSKQLAILRGNLLTKAKEPGHYAIIGDIAKAEEEAKNGNGAKTLEYLSKVGKWGLSVAEKIGVAVAAGAIKTSIGI